MNLRVPNRQGGSGISGLLSHMNTRTIALIAILAVLVILLIALLSSCVRSCSKEGEKQDVVAVNELDARVAAGTSAELTNELTAVLDQNEKIAAIAANAGAYPDAAIVELALREPAAVDFVRAWPDADKTSAPYGDSITRGTVPQLYNWDSRWGNVEYAGLPIGVSGSGPTCLAMGYMGLTGKNDKTPVDLAAIAAADGYATGAEYTTGEFFMKVADSLGLVCEDFDPYYLEITASLHNGHPVICQIKANTFTPEAHWVIAAAVNDDETVVVYDPTSSAVSSHPWAATTLASYSEHIYVLENKDEDQQSNDGGDTESQQSSENAG